MNELKHSAEFQSVLEGYKPSSIAKKVLAKAQLVLLCGVTAAGRNSIINGLLKTGDYYHILADTTRQIRVKNGQPIEKNGREYWFRTEEEVLEDLRTGRYIEAAILHNQHVSGWSIDELQKANQAHKIAVKDIDPVGAQTTHELKPDTKQIFLLPPSFEIWMERLHGRGGIAEEEIARRLNSAVWELATALTQTYYTFVINTDLNEAIVEVDKFVKSGQSDLAVQAQGRQLAKQLKQATEDYLLSKT